MGIAAGPAARLVSYGNAFLSGRYDAGRRTRDAIEPAVKRWRFDTLCERRGGFMPLRIVAHGPHGWFRWLRAERYTRLVLLKLSALDAMALDGPLKVFTATQPGWFVGALREGLPMVWDEWKRGPAGFYGTGPLRVEYRGAEVYAAPVRDPPDAEAVAARLDAVLAEAAALTPDEAPGLDRARAALLSAAPESLLERAAAPLLAPGERKLTLRRLAAAVQLAKRADRAVLGTWDWHEPGGSPLRPAGYGAALDDAILAAVNSATAPGGPR